jgi:hypothetical protein
MAQAAFEAKVGPYRSLLMVVWAAAIVCAPPAAHAADLSLLTRPAQLTPDQNSSWLAMVSATQDAQPHWITPFVTVTPRLEQEFRYDTYLTNQANGSHIDNFGAGKGPEFIPTYNTEISLGLPPYEELTNPKGRTSTGFGDWPAFLLKYRFLGANEEHGNYILTAFIQTAAPTGFAAISNKVYVVQPTIALGKGWGDFDIQATISEQFAVDSIGPTGSLQAFGNPFLTNVSLQYHLLQYFWPEFEVNYTYWTGGPHKDLSQALLMPGLIIGRIPLGGRNNLIVGAGYQFAVTDNPVTKNNWVITTRATF